MDLTELNKTVETIKSKKRMLKEKKSSYIKGIKKRLNRLEKGRILKLMKSLNPEGQPSETGSWSRKDLLTLICRVFKFGENDWDLNLFNDQEPKT